jgi:hypothetical protein
LQAGEVGNKVEILAPIAGRGDPARWLLAAEEGATLRNEIYDRRTRDVWGARRVTLLGDAAQAAVGLEPFNRAAL